MNNHSGNFLTKLATVLYISSNDDDEVMVLATCTVDIGQI
jgi:hypothetical protein